LLKNKVPLLPNSSLTQWYELLTILTPQWIIPLLYGKIMNIPEESRPPKEIMDELRSVFFENRIRSITVEKQLREVLNTFKKDNIRVLVLKGSTFARTVYPDPAFRYSRDIDILVHPDDFIHSREIMKKMGYRSAVNYFDISKYYYC
jgi:hypothetical protein